MNFLDFSSVTLYFGKALRRFTATRTDFVILSETICTRHGSFSVYINSDKCLDCQNQAAAHKPTFGH